MILEREKEQAEIAALLADAERGEGGMLVLRGPAGIGKTALLRHAAVTPGFRTLQATALPLEAELPFGLAHQLFAPVVEHPDERLFAGAAGHAASLLIQHEATGPSHGLLHALYWLCANLAEEQPLLILVDDLQWADELSLRFLGFLARRLDGLTVAVIAGTRPSPGEPLARTLELTPLSEHAAGHLLAGTLGEAPDAAFTAACHSATGGNPLLLRELARTAAEHALQGAAAESDEVLALGSQGVAPALERRLATLTPAATQIARATAVFGPSSRIDDLAALVGISVQDAAGAVADLARAGLFEPGAHAFTHPLVREAVLAATGDDQRVLLHSGSAARLRERDAWPAEIAVHLLHTRPAGQRATIYTLRTAARNAVADGAVDTAIAYLRRALEEPPDAVRPRPARRRSGGAGGRSGFTDRRGTDRAARGCTAGRRRAHPGRAPDRRPRRRRARRPRDRRDAVGHPANGGDRAQQRARQARGDHAR